MTEFALQCAAADFLSWALPDNIPFTHLPMGGKRDKATAGKLKAMGVNPGWPDFEILILLDRAAPGRALLRLCSDVAL